MDSQELSVTQLEVGQVVDVYYVIPNGPDGRPHALKDIAEVVSTGDNPEPAITVASILSQSEAAVWALFWAILMHWALPKWIEAHEQSKIVKIHKKNVSIHTPKPRNPIFFEGILKNKEKLKKGSASLQYHPEMGKGPPSEQIYPEAKKKLWIMRATYSEDLLAKQPSKLVNQLKEKPRLTLNLSIMEPTQTMKELAREEIDSLYLSSQRNPLLSQMIQNAYSAPSLEKYLYPWEFDYCRKLNDSYAGLTHLALQARQDGFQDRLRFFTSTNPGLRSSFAYGKHNIIDFTYFNKGWTGTSGTVVRCTDAESSFSKELMGLAEKEREQSVKEEPDLIAKIADVLGRLLDRYGLLRKPVSEYLSSPKDTIAISEGWEEVNQLLKDKSSNYEQRLRFLQDLDTIRGNGAGVLIVPLA